MKQVKAATGKYVKGDIQEQDRREFKDARIFVSETIIPIEYTEPKDTAKVKTLGTDPSAGGIIFVPAPISIPQDQLLNNAPIPAPAPAPSYTPISTPAADLDAVANVNCRLDALQGKIEDLTRDNKDSKQELAGFKQELAESKDKLATWQKLSEEREAAYDDIRGWLVTNDTKYMDRLRLRQNNLGQACLDLPNQIDLQSQHAELGASRTVHPAQVDSTTYSEVVARQPDDQRTLIQAFIDYSLKFRP
ncbi:uncharacterized protein EV420DRAFT_1634729 [Desarmillaria tabescens]|uniref:Uncharacterized protein n=1 Tax=Armillaria tabescens TaxID=1929756 RepID=A0AA39NR54_ARMTA|nr:uncharacterized protein EV420DRAFT_1634729 [Desarmillaria tabescens]KAK0470296.1 hypothetical protein EV420DRAFT_1634729 [Desarmillaria tabescens]